MPIPDFIDHPDTDERILPPGVHQASIHEVREALVEQFGLNSTRDRIFTGWAMHRTVVRSLLPISAEYLDGSFVTARENPADIDVSYWTIADAMNQLAPEDRRLVRFLTNPNVKDEVKAIYSTDSFLLTEADYGQPAHPWFTHMREWTEEYWPSYTNQEKLKVDGVEKGYIQVTDV